MTTTSKVAFNTGVMIAGRALTAFLSILTIAYITRYLGVAGFGQYTTIFAYVTTFAVLADFGFTTILVREIAKAKEDPSLIASNIFTFRTFFGFLVFLIAFLVALLLPYPALVKAGIFVIAIATFFLTLNATLVGVFQAQLKMERAVLGDVVGRFLIWLLILLVIHFKGSLVTLLWIYVIGNFVNLLVSFWLVRAYAKIKFIFDWARWQQLAKEAWPLGIATILGVVSFKIDTVILSLFKNSTDVGIYGAAYKMFDFIVVLPAIFMGNVFPIITRYLNENDPRAKDVIQRSFNFLSLMAWPAFLGIFFLAKPIIGLVAGQEFLETSTLQVGQIAVNSVFVLQVLSFAVFLFFMTNLYPPLLIARGLQKVLILPYLSAAIFNVVANIIFIPHFSYLAAAVITFLTELIVLIINIYLVWKYLRFVPSLSYWARIVPAALALGILLFWTSQLNIFITVILAILVYGAGIILTGAVTKQSIKEVLGR